MLAQGLFLREALDSPCVGESARYQACIYWLGQVLEAPVKRQKTEALDRSFWGPKEPSPLHEGEDIWGLYRAARL